jgi:hypothetical protein
MENRGIKVIKLMRNHILLEGTRLLMPCLLLSWFLRAMSDEYLLLQA